MIDHLQVMGIQRWQQRKVVAKQMIENSVEVVKNADEQKTANGAVNFSIAEPIIESVAEPIVEKAKLTQATLSAYAATSLRFDSQGQQCRWLWVLPQSSLNAEELKLIDKIVSATGSAWESSSIADSYLDADKLENTLVQNLSAVIFFASEVSWDAFEQHSLFSEKRFLYADSAKNLIDQPEKKRIVWQNLQTLMA